MTNTQTRVVTAAVAVPILILLIFIGGLPWGILISVAAAIGTYEFYGMAEARGYKALAPLGIAVSFGFCFALALHQPATALGFIVIGLMVASALELRGDPEGAMANLGATFSGILYVGVLLSHAILVRSYMDSNKLGIFFIITAIGGSMICDAGAYFIGRAYGKRKLIPHISPGKTVEGSAGGFIAGILAVCLSKAIGGMFMTVPFGWGKAVLLGAMITIGGMIGDLIISMLKRDSGVKDSGKIIPGHGGILDRLDSLVWAIPVTYYFAIWAT